MIHFDRQIAIGIVFDLSLQHHSNGQRYIDITKAALVSFALKLGMNCYIFVAHPDNDMPTQQGESVAQISGYIEPPHFNAPNALLQAFEVIKNQEMTEKYIILLTNRFKIKEKYNYCKPIMINQTKKNNCQFFYISLGNKDLQECENCKVYINPEINQELFLNIIGDK